ncbi:hypothetical protein [Actinospica robiniae]|uniref:hypothetical protein n=1 Tax=Actinospica robiniae TaxID=304901 RepID=UPI000410189B|nr:hypothetical protein [Actinospica robiniae]
MSPTAGPAVLLAGGAGGWWAWSGLRLKPVLGLTSAHNYLDVSAPEREERLAQAEGAWLSAQWSPEAGTAFEIRYLSRPPSGRLECAVLTRAGGPTAEAARARAGQAVARLAQLPPHVRGEEIEAETEIHSWMVPFTPAARGLVEIRKRLTWAQITRTETGRRVGLAFGEFGPGRSDWEELLRALAQLPYRAALSICFVPFPIDLSFRKAVADLAEEYAYLGRPGNGDIIFNAPAQADPFAKDVTPRYALERQRYVGPCYRVRVSLAAEGELPDYLGQFAATAMAPGGGAVAMRPVGEEGRTAVSNLNALNSDWLAATYAQGVPPTALAPAEQVLADLVDPFQARAVMRMPTHRAGHEELFDPVRQYSETPQRATEPSFPDPGLDKDRFG